MDSEKIPADLRELYAQTEEHYFVYSRARVRNLIERIALAESRVAELYKALVIAADEHMPHMPEPTMTRWIKQARAALSQHAEEGEGV